MTKMKVLPVCKCKFFISWFLFALTFYMFVIGNHEIYNFTIDGPKVTPQNGIKTISFKMQDCDCIRTLKVTTSVQSKLNVSHNKTTCSQDASKRGFGQKVVGFSFYGNLNSSKAVERDYFAGIIENLKLISRFYPGWVMRLYFEIEKTDPLQESLCEVACNYDEIDICNAANLPGTPVKDARQVFPMNWRFFPTLDPQVDVFVSRDLDSRFSEREKAAVKEWLESDKPFHFMRGHPLHGTTILGGGWGIKLHNESMRKKWIATWNVGWQDPLVWANRSLGRGADQEFLNRYVWPWAKNLAMTHDSYLCSQYSDTRPFPSQRKNEPNNFFGSVVNQGFQLKEECPENCRPKLHKDWLYC